MLQSKLKFTANGSVVFDACRLNGTLLYDTSTAFVRVLRQGLTNVYNTTTPNKIANFVNKASYVIDEYGDFHSPAPPTPGITEINASRGEVIIPSSASSITVYNLFVREHSLLFTQLKTFDTGGARIASVNLQWGYFVIYLNQPASADLHVAFNLLATA